MCIRDRQGGLESFVKYGKEWMYRIPVSYTHLGPGYASSTFTLYTIKTAFTFSDFGLASTMAMAIMFMIIIIYIIQNKVCLLYTSY